MDQATAHSLLKRWSEINSGSDHIEGLRAMEAALSEAFGAIPGVRAETVALPGTAARAVAVQGTRL